MLLKGLYCDICCKAFTTQHAHAWIGLSALQFMMGTFSTLSAGNGQVRWREWSRKLGGTWSTEVNMCHMWKQKSVSRCNWVCLRKEGNLQSRIIESWCSNALMFFHIQCAVISYYRFYIICLFLFVRTHFRSVSAKSFRAEKPLKKH